MGDEKEPLERSWLEWWRRRRTLLKPQYAGRGPEVCGVELIDMSLIWGDESESTFEPPYL
jgi:hypothetical protein